MYFTKFYIVFVTFSLQEKSVWIDILKMENEIEVNYDELETLYVDKERVTPKKRQSSCNKVGDQRCIFQRHIIF